jgi:hypothetical protein
MSDPGTLCLVLFIVVGYLIGQYLDWKKRNGR